MFWNLFGWLAVLTSISYVNSQLYSVPPIQFQALKKGGFRALLPDFEGTTFFTLHANVNDNIAPQSEGSISAETKVSKNGYWILEFDNKLRIGDVMYYWVLVHVNNFGYRKDANWTVKALLNSYPSMPSRCDAATTIASSATVICLDSLIINDEFSGTAMDKSIWTIEHRIPTYAPPLFEFNSYEDRQETCFLKDGKLFLKPFALNSDSEVRGVLDLRDGCSSTENYQCYYEQQSSFLLPPVKSARITSKISFKYGKIEIKAKLPSGDWLFPVIQLQPKDRIDENVATILIAYSRGNDRLTGINPNDMTVRLNSGNDLGSRLLFAGPSINPAEPGRSKHLVSKRSEEPFNKDFHVYTMHWTPGVIKYYVDNEEYGTVNLNKSFVDSSLGIGSTWTHPGDPFNNQFVLSIGVAVGGMYDFPDDMHGSSPKPWVNGERNYLKKFFEARSQWLQTWRGDGPAMQIDYVKVTSV